MARLVGMCKGGSPTAAAKGKQTSATALCQTPGGNAPPPYAPAAVGVASAERVPDPEHDLRRLGRGRRAVVTAAPLADTAMGAMITPEGRPVAARKLQFETDVRDLDGLQALFDMSSEERGAIEQMTLDDGKTQLQFAVGAMDYKEVWMYGPYIIYNELDQRLPSVNRQLPSVNRQLPSVNRQLPSVNRQLPSVNRQLPSVNRQLPPVNRQLPSVNRQLPSVNRQLPSVNRQLPSVNRQLPPVNR